MSNQNVIGAMNVFPLSEYAHCPFCGATEGMGLMTERGRCFVQCFCGARGPSIDRNQFQKSGSLGLDVEAMDNATRAAWNCRAGSNGMPEMQVALMDAVGRMVRYKNTQIMTEVDRWVKLIAAAEVSLRELVYPSSQAFKCDECGATHAPGQNTLCSN